MSKTLISKVRKLHTVVLLRTIIHMKHQVLNLIRVWTYTDDIIPPSQQKKTTIVHLQVYLECWIQMATSLPSQTADTFQRRQIQGRFLCRETLMKSIVITNIKVLFSTIKSEMLFFTMRSSENCISGITGANKLKNISIKQQKQ